MDPWDAMGDEEDETYSGPDAYLDDDDDYDGLDFEIEEEVEQLGEEAETFENLMNQLDATENPSEAIVGNTRLQRLLATIPMAHLVRSFAGRVPAADDESEDDDDYYGRAPVQEKGDWFKKVTKPQPAGVQLLMGGEFGRVRNRLDALQNGNMFDRLQRTAVRLRNIYREDLIHDIIPNTHGTAVAIYPANVYCGQYSADSSFYYTCGQDFRLHIYDTKAAPKRDAALPAYYLENEDGHITTMTTIKNIRGVHGNWTITDSHLSPDNQRMIYSSMAPTVYMTNTLDSSTKQIPISFADRSDRDLWSSPIWCCRFSADGNEVFAGGLGPIYVYDLVSNRRIIKIPKAHNDDVNSCCWADTASGNVLISGSDDGFIKVWDRRSLGAAQNPSGVLVGHTEGITYVSAKGDGRYVISNGKDQALRLWDLRKMRSSKEFDEIRCNRYSINYDYRQAYYPNLRVPAHPKDCSVMTYRGHAVLRTLIRCHFSPVETTGGQYLYSGSWDGKIHIWSLDGRVVQVLDRSMTLSMASDPSAAEPTDRKSSPRNQVCVRDISWHPQEPVLMSAAWEGRPGMKSTVARHEWKGLAKGGQLEDWVEKRKLECAEQHKDPGS